MYRVVKKEKRCSKGKACGSTCIPQSKKCRVQLKREPSESIEGLIDRLFGGGGSDAPLVEPSSVKVMSTLEVMKDISDILRGEDSYLPDPKTEATGNTQWAREDAKFFDERLPANLRREGDKSYDGWGDSFARGSYSVGSGDYGFVIRNADGTYIKRGALSDSEARIMNKLGSRDLAPKLIAADINGIDAGLNRKGGPVEIRKGRIAMTKVEGQPLADIPTFDIPGGKGKYDTYWKAMADLHRLGVAHNDAHAGNILVDSKGKGRWVDFGLSQDSPKAALAEAMGVFPELKGVLASRAPSAVGKKGNWQSERSRASGVKDANFAKSKGGAVWSQFAKENPLVARVWENKEKAERKLQEYGLTRGEISGIIAHGIRAPMSSFEEGPWRKLSDQQALDVIMTLYEGV